MKIYDVNYYSKKSTFLLLTDDANVILAILDSTDASPDPIFKVGDEFKEKRYQMYTSTLEQEIEGDAASFKAENPEYFL